jgi:hypothetical protein
MKRARVFAGEAASLCLQRTDLDPQKDRREKKKQHLNQTRIHFTLFH